MKAVYRCDFCGEMGTEQEIFVHEAQCPANPHRLNCSTCEYSGYKSLKQFKCMFNESREVPPEKEFVNCPDHKVKEHFDGMNNIFKSMFGGVKNG